MSSAPTDKARPGGLELTIAPRVLALDEEALRGRNVGFTADSALHPLGQPCRRRGTRGGFGSDDMETGRIQVFQTTNATETEIIISSIVLLGISSIPE
jgi:hypothetical protein